jgi:hypothetical protein
MVVCIHRVIERVLANGHEFEQALIDKETHNPRFSFLVDHKVRGSRTLDSNNGGIVLLFVEDERWEIAELTTVVSNSPLDSRQITSITDGSYFP